MPCRELRFPEDIIITNSMEEAAKDSELIVMAVASSFVRSTSKLLKRYVDLTVR